MPDPLFARMYRDTEDLIWAPTEQVRRRGRQRQRRTRVAAGLASVAAVAVFAVGAAALAGTPDAAPPIPPATGSPTPTPTPSATPGSTASPTPSTGTTPTDVPPSSPPRTSGRPTTGSTAVPSAALLRLSDLPDGFRAAGSDLDGDWSLESVTIYCRDASPSLAVGQVSQRGVVFESSTTSIVERVSRHSGSNAATSMDRARQLVTDCVPHRAGDSLSILAEGLAGDEALLVGSSIEGVASRWLFVRQGDLVAQVRLDSRTTPAEARRYARPVAERLCAGTDAC